MIKSAHILIFALLISLASLPLEAQSDIPKPNWSRPMALETAGSIDTQAVLKPLFQLAREGKDECSTAAIQRWTSGNPNAQSSMEWNRTS